MGEGRLEFGTQAEKLQESPLLLPRVQAVSLKHLIINKYTVMELTGRVTADAVISITKSGKEVVEFSIAVNNYYKPKGATEAVQVTQYVECSYWIGKGVVSRLLKGVVAEVSGRTSVQQPYIGKDGTAKASLNMHCNAIKVNGRNSSGKTKETGTGTGQKPVIENIAAITEPMDDMPF